MPYPAFYRRCAAGVALPMVLMSAGCGDDDVARDSSNRGAGTTTESTSVENAFIVPEFARGQCAIQVGDSADLRFTVSNTRSTEAERLLAISTPAADTVRISPNATLEILPQTTIAAGQPVENLDNPDAPDEPFTVTLEGLKDGVTPGKAVGVTFEFEKFGPLQMQVSIEACPA